MQKIHQARPALQTWSDLPTHIRSRLEAEGLESPQQWLTAGRRRFQIFGVTRAMAELLDALAREPQE